MMAEEQQQGGIAPHVFEAAEDAYGGVTVELRESSMDSGDFVTVLRASLSEWRDQVYFLYIRCMHACIS